MIFSVLCKLIVFTHSQSQYHVISFYSEFYVSPLQEERNRDQLKDHGWD